jgi:prepilin-type processing-associated H-X9-DG protein
VYNGFFYTAHGKAMNLAFLDGHASSCIGDDFYPLASQSLEQSCNIYYMDSTVYTGRKQYVVYP